MVGRQWRTGLWAPLLVVGAFLLLLGTFIGMQTPDETERVTSEPVPLECGAPFTPGPQRDVLRCATSLDRRRSRAEVALAAGGLLLVTGLALWAFDRRTARRHGDETDAAVDSTIGSAP